MFMQFIVLAHLKGLKVDGTQDSKRRQQPVSLTDDLFRHFFFFFLFLPQQFCTPRSPPSALENMLTNGENVGKFTLARHSLLSGLR